MGRIKYELDCYLDPKEVAALGADLISDDNSDITETAGFIPLEVKLKQFEQNGLIAQFSVQDFDSHDYRDMYLNPDFNITPEDDFEEVQEKLQMQRNFMNELKTAKAASVESAEPGEARSGAKAAESKQSASVDIEEKVTSKE